MKIKISLEVYHALILIVLLCIFVFFDASNSFASEIDSKGLTLYASPSTQALERIVKAEKLKKADTRSFKVFGRIDDYRVSFKYTGKQRLKVESTTALQLSQSISFEEMIKKKLVHTKVTPVIVNINDGQSGVVLDGDEFKFIQYVGFKYGSVARKINDDLETVTLYTLNGYNVFERQAIDSHGNVGGYFRATKYDPAINKDIEVSITWGEGLTFGMSSPSTIVQYYLYRQAAYNSLDTILATLEVKN